MKSTAWTDTHKQSQQQSLTTTDRRKKVVKLVHVTTRLKSPARVVFLQSVISPVGGRGKGEISLLRIVIRWRTLKANNRYASTSTRNSENKRREITIRFCDKLYYGIIRKTITRETFYNRFFAQWAVAAFDCPWSFRTRSCGFFSQQQQQQKTLSHLEVDAEHGGRVTVC